MYDKELITGYKRLSKDDVKKLIVNNEIEMIRVEYVDIFGVNRAKLIPSEMVDEAMKDGLAFASAIFWMGLDNSVAEYEGKLDYTYDDMKIVADPSTFIILPYLEKTALMLGDIYYHGEPMALSPRWFLKNIINKYVELGYNPISAGELEFFLFNRCEDGKSVTQYTNQPGNCYTENIRIDRKGFLPQITKSFKKMGYKVLYMNHEFYPGQYEYNWKYGQALKNADEISIFKGVCKDIADKNELMATFMAKPLNDNGGSGCHYHISLNSLETGKNIFYDESDPEGISEIMKNFMAGVLKHAKALVAFLAPTINCYKRYCPDSFAPCNIGWGYDNRTTYIRIPDERKAATRVEVRAGSAAANPYLALGGILAAGLDGIINKLDPPEVIKSDLYHDKEKQVEYIPRSLEESLKLIENDKFLCDMAGEDLMQIFLALKRMEVESFKSSVTDWEWKNYSYHI